MTQNTFQDGNDTSTVIKFTVGSQTFMVLADARMHMSDQLLATYPASVLKSDIVQMSHHGYTGARDELYQAIDADVVLWPMDVVNYSNADEGSYSTLFKNYYNNDSISANDYVRKNAVEVIPSYENVCLTMPYTAKTYSNGQKTIDLDAAYSNKVYTSNVDTFAVDTSWYDANASTYYLYDAGDVFGFAELAKGGNTFSGKKIVLMADIDLNPGWSAEVTIGDKVNFPSAPTNTWPNIASFAGTLDGNGYTLSGIYSSKSVSSNKGAYGGLFNTFAGGTIKNLRLSNSFMTVANSSWGSANIHVGGIAGEVNEGSLLYNVYMDETVEVWFKSNEHCDLGGAYAFANGAHTVQGFVFTGRLGNTNNDYAPNYACASNKTIRIAMIIANQNNKGGSITNSLCLNTSLYTGKNYNTNSDRVGVQAGSVTVKCCANTRESAEWLLTRPDDYGKSHVWSDVLQSIVPYEAETLVNGTYAHEAVNNKSEFAPTLNDENIYYIYTAEDLIDTVKNGGDFSGKTIMLMKDIDLNPGWDATVTIDEKVNFPSAAPTAWPNIASFAGTFDGNGYTLSGVYTSKSVSGNKGAYGGLFNVLAGGTIKNLRLSNSFMTVANSSWGSANIHVGGIAGEVNEGSLLYNVYMDETVEVWFKSNEHCDLGGAYAFANGAHTVQGFVFTGRLGNTNNDYAPNYACASNKTIRIAMIIANQNNKGGSITNSLCLNTSLYTGKNYNTNSDRVGVQAGSVTVKCCANTRESAEWLLTRPDDYGKSHVWSDVLQSIVPREAETLVNGTYSHITDYAKVLDTPEMFYQVSDVVDGKYNIRFVSGISEINYSNKVGFDITLIVDGVEYPLDHAYTTTDTVYESILANGKPVKADSLGYDYLYSQEITNIPATEKITIKIAAVNIDAAGNTMVGTAMTFQFHYGNGYVTAR